MEIEGNPVLISIADGRFSSGVDLLSRLASSYAFGSAHAILTRYLRTFHEYSQARRKCIFKGRHPPLQSNR